MQISIKSTNLALTDAIKSSVEKKFAKFIKISKKWTPEDSVLDVEIGKETMHHGKGNVFFAEAHLVSGKNDIYARVATDDLYKSIEKCVEDCKRQFLSIKGKIFAAERKRNGKNVKMRQSSEG